MMKKKSFVQTQFDHFMRHYLEAMCFTDFETEVELPPLSQEMAVQVLRECGTFYLLAREYMTDDNDLEMCAHDFWYTRNGHGAGFWDGDWPEPACSKLTGFSERFGEAHVYKGDDGLLYQSGGCFR